MTSQRGRTGRWLQVVGAALVLLASVSFVIARGHGALAAPNPPTATVTPNTGLTDPTNGVPGEQVSVAATNFPADTVLTAEECSGTTSSPPTDNSSCNGTTETLSPLTDASGATTFNTRVFVLPDASAAFHNSLINCDANNPCVLYVGVDATDFTQPKAFVNLGFATAATTTTTSSTTTTVPSSTTSTTTATTSTTAGSSSTSSTTGGSSSSTAMPTLGSASAAVGSSVTITGSSLGSAATITFALDGTTNLGSTTSGSDGSFSFTFTVPATASLGQHVVTASTASGLTANFSLTVVAASGTTNSSSDSGSGLPVTGGPLASPVVALVGVGAILVGTDLRRKALHR